ncbi:MAG: FKBP-type peptidyl-prolyl cis-trans isomerase [Tannerella sp.]|jgi:peptidylprolyl isomerase/FKBP-type peptidyl-prolyl cis-trans isomerase FklB|nr:FKBP-type peptidyl-prolyl cis-trans isomerase [Tannerella sp.]
MNNYSTSENRTNARPCALAKAGRAVWIWALLPLFFAASCSDDENGENVLDVWKSANEQALNDIARNPEFTEIKSPGDNGSIYYRVIEKGSGTKTVYYTSQVKVYYKGWFVAGNSELGIEKDHVFDHRLFDDGAPVTFALSTGASTYDSYTGYNPPIPIDGWTVALQHMVKGDKWEIWLPAQLAYGTSGQSGSSGTIPGHSTLAFEIEVVGVTGIDGDTE